MYATPLAPGGENEERYVILQRPALTYSDTFERCDVIWYRPALTRGYQILGGKQQQLCHVEEGSVLRMPYCIHSYRLLVIFRWILVQEFTWCAISRAKLSAAKSAKRCWLPCTLV